MRSISIPLEIVIKVSAIRHRPPSNPACAIDEIAIIQPKEQHLAGNVFSCGHHQRRARTETRRARVGSKPHATDRVVMPDLD